MKTFFCNRTVDKSEMKRLIKWVLLNYGSQKATCLVDQLKTLGFHYATQAGISLGIDDLRIPPVKTSLLLNADNEIAENEARWSRGQVTSVDRLKKALDVWNTTNDTLKNAVIDHFKETDVFNPVYMMAFSGARGNISQVRQLVGMRGLMADPQGQILDFPIRRNFREGLTVTEYMISCYGARKGLVDTALRTANSGYLTRRLVDVAQNVIIQHVDCYPSRGLTITTQDPRFEDKVIGRVLFRDVIHEHTGQLLARKNTDISSFVAQKLQQVDYIMVRSPLTCNFQSVCQLCYGWSLAQQKLVQLGEAVGVLAAQSIGEPGTQLTMRTFHTGGVFAGEATEKVYSPHAGKVEYFSTLRGQKVTTYYGETAFLSLSPVKLRVRRRQGYQSAILEFPALTLLFARPGEYVNYYQSIAELSRVDWEVTKRTRQPELTEPPKRQDGPVKQTLAEFDGQIYQEFKGQTTRQYQYNGHPNRGSWLWGFEDQQTHRLWNLAGQFQPVRSLARGDSWTDSCQRFYASGLAQLNQEIELPRFFGLDVLHDTNFSLLATNQAQLITPFKHTSLDRLPNPFVSKLSVLKQFKPFTKLWQSDRIQRSALYLSYLLSPFFLELTGGQNATNSWFCQLQPFYISQLHSTNFTGLSFVQNWKITDLIDQYGWMFRNLKTVDYPITNRQVSHRILKLETRVSGVDAFFSPDSQAQLVKRSPQLGVFSKNYQRKKGRKRTLQTRRFAHRQSFAHCKVFGSMSRHLPGSEQSKYLKNIFFLVKGYFLPTLLLDSLGIGRRGMSWIKADLYLNKGYGTPIEVRQKAIDIREYVNKVISWVHSAELFPKQAELVASSLKSSIQWRELIGNSPPLVKPEGLGNSKSLGTQVGGVASKGEYRVDSLGILQHFSGLKGQEKLNEILSYFALKRRKMKLPNLTYDDGTVSTLLQRGIDQGIPIFHSELGGVSVYDLILAAIYPTRESSKPGLTGLSHHSSLCLTPQVQTCFTINADKVNLSIGSFARQDDLVSPGVRLPMSGQVIVRRIGHIIFRHVQAYKLLSGCNMVLHVKHGGCVQANTPLLSIPSVESTAGDIVQGLPKVDELLEARETTVAGPSGQNMHQILSGVFSQYSALYGMRLGCEYSFHVIRQQLVSEVQAVYQSQGVYISDKHVEIIVRQMTGKVFIIDAGTTRLLPGDIIDFRRVERISRQCVNTRKQLQYRPILLGITRASLAAESFIAAASFQETKRVLARSALEGRLDWLMGLKENVILGRLIPAGTGFYF